MASYGEKFLEYWNAGFKDYCFFERRQRTGYTHIIEARNGESRIFLLYDPQKGMCREMKEKELKQEAAERRIERIFRKA